MKLEMSLPERPGLLHAVPVCDLFVILWLLFLLGSGMMRHAGVSVELPPSQFQLGRYEQTYVITLGPGEGVPRIHFGRDVVTMDGLLEQLGRLRAKGSQTRAVVLLQSDGGTPVEIERRVAEAVLSMGFRLALVGSDATVGRVPPDGEQEGER